MVWGLIDWPLRTLYLNGPSLLGYGWWEGVGEADLCSQITGVGAEFWDGEHSQDACGDLIERKVFAFEIGTLAITTLGMTILLGSTLYWRWCILRPLTQELKMLWSPRTLSTASIKYTTDGTYPNGSSLGHHRDAGYCLVPSPGTALHDV